MDTKSGIMPLREEFQQRGITLDFIPMEDELDGILINFPGHWLCLINSLKPLHRQRFTMAHELAHYDLHRGMAQVFADGLKIESTWMERQANIEAACILMPEESVTPFWEAICNRHSPGSRIMAMSWQFGVSEEAMQYRLQDLGLISRREGLR